MDEEEDEIINNLEILSTSSITTYHPSEDNNNSSDIVISINPSLSSTTFERDFTEESTNSGYELKELLYQLFNDDKIVNIIFSYYI